ncbi:carbohydrate esterase family 5 protein [Myriangium duriaei CBS 260.36]|uniref:Cutinase n=1 Tax=Myriangium duriaei CBS 260.36 TaxID=1168546 RepID=A0A9P4MID0_9PEZI|nr:carbohydrate esterase family 5 protein [Myriangium duriaei CBS 260.36]
MKFSIFAAAILAGLATAAPTAIDTGAATGPARDELDGNELSTASNPNDNNAAVSTLANTRPPDAPDASGPPVGPDTANQLTGPCRPVTFIYARGSTQKGNMGTDIGPSISAALQKKYGAKNVATQGLNYKAALKGNLEKQGCDAAGIATFIADLKSVATKCPKSKVVVGGYSQGAACLHAAFRGSAKGTLSHVVAAVTFGDTRNKQDGGKFPNFPVANSKIFCDPKDPVCNGTIIVGPGHFEYNVDIAPATSFFVAHLGKVKALDEE